MIGSGQVDRAISAWLVAEAPTREPDWLIGSVLERTSHTPRRPALLVPPVWFVRPETYLARGGRWRHLALAVAAVLLLASLMGLAAMAGGLLRLRGLDAPSTGVIVVSLHGDLALVDAGGHLVRVLTRTGTDTSGTTYDEGPVWSPDGDRVAFWRFQGTKGFDSYRQTLMAIGTDGSGLIALRPTEPYQGGSMAWNPDGTRISIASQDSIELVATDGTQAKTVIPGGYAAAWSPDGRWLAFVTRGNQLHIETATGTADRALTGSTALVEDLAWAPDGSRIAYEIDRGNDPAQGRDVWVIDLASGAARAVASDVADEFNVSWAADSRSLLYTRGQDTGDLVELDLVTGARRVLHSPGFIGAQWSPDGRLLLGFRGDSSAAFVWDPAGSAAPVMINADGGASDWRPTMTP